MTFILPQKILRIYVADTERESNLQMIICRMCWLEGHI